jgi:hypothetical protein
MVSFMRYCKKANCFFILLFFCFQAMAGVGSIAIKSADLSPHNDVYRLNADLEFSLDEAIEEAINKGVPVTFLYEFELEKSRSFWFDKSIATASTSITVSYHALSRQYLVSQSGRQTSHEILSEAMIELVQLYDWTVFDKSIIESDATYKATLDVKLDQTTLPKAIQVEAIGSEDWSLVAEQFEWIPKDLNP